MTPCRTESTPAGGRCSHYACCWAYVEPGGDLIVARRAETARLALGALPDARILADPEGRLPLLTGATRRYGHGALGNDVEAGRPGWRRAARDHRHRQRPGRRGPPGRL